MGRIKKGKINRLMKLRAKENLIKSEIEETNKLLASGIKSANIIRLLSNFKLIKTLQLEKIKRKAFEIGSEQ
jgi:hypothetical protein